MSFTQSLLNRELFGNKLKSRQMLFSVIESHPLVCDYMKTFNSTVNYMDIESIDYKFLLIGCSDGNVSINEIIDQNSGHLNRLINKKYESSVNRCQWYPIDSGMFNITSSDCVTLIDTNTLRTIDKYMFEKSKLYWSDWNTNNTTTIAVSCSSSAIRIIDIRSGSAVQQITLSSMTGTSNHNITRVVWSPLDTEGLIAGDSSGYLHIYDIRRPNRCVEVVGSEYTSCEPITCLTFSPNNMSVITCHGLSNKLNLWNFKNSKLINSGINFQCPLIRTKQSKQNTNSSYFRCQIFATDEYVFTPNETKQWGKDVLSYEISTGMKAHSLSTSKVGTFGCSGPNCVNGLNTGSLVIYSAGNQRICAWTPKIDLNENKINLDKYQTDRWSDDE